MIIHLLRLEANLSFEAEAIFAEILGLASANESHHANLDADGFMQTALSVTHRSSKSRIPDRMALNV